MSMQIIDDGTLDTVIECTICARVYRYTYAAHDDKLSYAQFLKGALLDAEDRHYSNIENDCKGV